jgi:hypothetical protein
MTDDLLTDEWLHDAMAGKPPELSAAFDAKVLRQVRRRGLDGTGRLVMTAYTVAAAWASIYVAREAGPALVTVSSVAGGLAAIALSSYVRTVLRR